MSHSLADLRDIPQSAYDALASRGQCLKVLKQLRTVQGRVERRAMELTTDLEHLVTTVHTEEKHEEDECNLYSCDWGRCHGLFNVKRAKGLRLSLDGSAEMDAGGEYDVRVKLEAGAGRRVWELRVEGGEDADFQLKADEVCVESMYDEPMGLFLSMQSAEALLEASGIKAWVSPAATATAAATAAAAAAAAGAPAAATTAAAAPAIAPAIASTTSDADTELEPDSKPNKKRGHDESVTGDGDATRAPIAAAAGGGGSAVAAGGLHVWPPAVSGCAADDAAARSHVVAFFVSDLCKVLLSRMAPVWDWGSWHECSATWGSGVPAVLLAAALDSRAGPPTAL